MTKGALGLVLCVFLSTAGYAQTLGTITGEVKDASGAAIPGATVTAQNVGTNAVRTPQSNEVGAFTFPAMPPGAYLVKAELQGFRPGQNGVELHVEETLRVSFTLEIGAIEEVTEVTAVTSLITTENATVGTVIENRRIVELPLNGRNNLSLIALSPNVSAGFAGAGQAGDRQGGSRANQQISICGSTRDSPCWSATRCRSPRTTAAAFACSTATRCSRRTATASSANGDCRSSTSGTAS
jgi:hypothetical protein